MDYRIEQFPIQPTVYMRRVGAYGSENHELMEKLKAWSQQRELLLNSTIYGIAYDDETVPPEKCRYDVCLVVNPDCRIDENVQCGEIPAGKYAVFTIPHTTEAVQEFWNSVFHVLQGKGLQHDIAKPILERYRYRLVENGQCEFCVPIL